MEEKSLQEIKNQLQNHFPHLMQDGEFDFSTFAELLPVLSSQTYGLQWKNKQQMLFELQKPLNAEFILKKEESCFSSKTENLFIESDNLPALKWLQTSYEGKIQMIYIDPPYNTGESSTFGYSDNFKGKQQKACQHSDWLNMMYPRLFWARKLLKPEGVIFISIDDNEVFPLKLMLDEIFGEDNFIGEFIWHNRTTPNDAVKKFATDHEFILIYAKCAEKCTFKGVEKNFSSYKNPDNDPNGPWIADNPSAASGNDKYRFPIENPYTGEVYFPPQGRYWAFSQKRVQEWMQSGKLLFPKENNKRFILKKYRAELKSTFKPISSVIQGILTSKGTRDMKKLFPEGSPFKYPKPVELIQLLIHQATQENDIILDFFAGSGTTAHAVMATNFEQKSKRKFICIQQAEKFTRTDDAYKAYTYVSDITKARICKVSEQFQQNLPKKTLLKKEDFGYKIYKSS